MATPTPSSAPHPDIAPTVGMFYLGVFLQAILHGMGLLQAFLYFTWFKSDGLFVRTCVVLITICEIFEMVASFTTGYEFFITSFGDFAKLGVITTAARLNLLGISIFFGHPGDSPHDIRARVFIVRWAGHLPEGAPLREHLEGQSLPVYRWNLPCKGVHEMAVLESDSDSTAEGNEEAGDEDDEDMTGGASQRKRYAECSSRVEVTADNLANAHIYQCNTHEAATADQLQHLQFSRVLRLQIMDGTRRFNTRLTTRRRLAVNPFLATHLMVERNPRDLYNYTPHDFSRPDSQSGFTLGITDNFSLDSLIVNSGGNDGALFIDSTHRLRSENRAATTALCTADIKLHMSPGAYLISANIKADTICAWLIATFRKVESRAVEIVEDTIPVEYRSEPDRARIFVRAKDISESGFCPTLIMMDKARAQYNGIVQALEALGIRARVYLRLCQFHVVYAIILFDTDSGKRGIGFTISMDIKFQILRLFRKLQRCRSYSDWDAAKSRFLTGLRRLLENKDEAELMGDTDGAEDSDGERPTKPVKKPTLKRGNPRPKTKEAKASGDTAADRVVQYFIENWLIEPWIPMYTDIGMPSAQSRDRVWNTNNFAESNFKQFNNIFLDNKNNKRIDRLAAIIHDDHLPYFRYFQTMDRPNAEYLRLHDQAHRVWESGNVRDAPGGVLWVADASGGKAKRYTVRLDPLSCTCDAFGSTGKDCVHILACRLHRSLGPVGPWLEAEQLTESVKLPAESRKTGKSASDRVVDREHDILHKRLTKDNTKRTRLPFPDVKFGEYRGKPGRPGTAKALQPWRRRFTNITPGTYGQRTFTHSPRFVQKRGRKAKQRIHPLSLFTRTVPIKRVREYTQPTEKSAPVGPLFGASDFALDQDSLADVEVLDALAYTSEEQDIAAHNLTRWRDAEFWFTADEMLMWVEFLNRSAVAVSRGIIFVSSGTQEMPFVSSLTAALGANPDATQAQLSLLHRGKDGHVSEVVFLELHMSHWTVYRHNLLTNPPTVTWYDSMQGTGSRVRSRTDSQCAIHVLKTARHLEISRGANRSTYGLDTVALGLQKDGYTCGFWALWIAFAILFEFQQQLTSLPIQARELKSLFSRIYSHIIGGERGGTKSEFTSLFQRFGVDFGEFAEDAVLFPRPSWIPRSNVIEVDAAYSPGPAEEPPVLDPAIEELLPRSGIYSNLQMWSITAEFEVKASLLQLMVDGGYIADGIIDGYLSLWMASFTGAKGLKFVVGDAITVRLIRTNPRNNKGMPRAKKPGNMSLWFPDVDIFDLDVLFLPLFWTDMDHWALAAVFFRDTKIQIYDSIMGTSTRRHLTYFDRIVEMLRWEHMRRYDNVPLPDSWPNWSSTAMVRVPQQNNTVDCGIYTVAFLQCLAKGEDPSALTFSPAHLRVNMANTVHAGIRACAANRTALGLADSDTESELTPIAWPSADAERSVSNNLPQYLLHDASQLREHFNGHSEDLGRQLRGEIPPTDLLNILQRDQSGLKEGSSDLELEIFPNFPWLRAPAYEDMVYEFGEKQGDTQIGHAYFLVIYTAFFTGIEVMEAYTHMRRGNIRWMESDSEQLWQVYIRCCGHYRSTQRVEIGEDKGR
ncbi:hypothetical protein MKEN_01412000 [Mycena kentingensis (nom. inval.)]|nr:hypothetical protein MKEN_01412000 [Mycena kentingensis (nom. inval.)]